jgi:hypothetical protein
LDERCCGTYDKPPKDEGTDDIDSPCTACQRLTEGSDNDNNQFHTICISVSIPEIFEGESNVNLHIRFRPITSESIPNTTWPMMAPTEAAALMPKSCRGESDCPGFVMRKLGCSLEGDNGSPSP